MGSAHHLTEMSILVKFDDSPSKGSGDMEWTSRRGIKNVGKIKICLALKPSDVFFLLIYFKCQKLLAF